MQTYEHDTALYRPTLCALRTSVASSILCSLAAVRDVYVVVVHVCPLRSPAAPLLQHDDEDSLGELRRRERLHAHQVLP